MRTAFRTNRTTGFTLAELLIALAILGVIATFTIPKILNAQQDQKKTAIAKEMMGAAGEVYLKKRADGSLISATGADFARQMNYVKMDATTVIDDAPSTGWGSLDCATWWAKCFVMHNGSIVGSDDTGPMGGTTEGNSIWLLVDTEASYQGDHNGFWIKVHGNGWITTDWLDRPNLEPSWFHW